MQNLNAQINHYITLLDIPAERMAKSGYTTPSLCEKLYEILNETKRQLSELDKHLDKNVHIAIVFAMWGEHKRLLPKTPENPTGEDSLAQKIEQLKWLFDGMKHFTWHLYPTDDGCPYNSAAIAEEIVKKTNNEANVSVLRLQDGVDKQFKGLKSVDDSRKGGAISYGAEAAINNGADIVIYTDTDISVHLGQIGRLITTLLKNDVLKAAIGDRRLEGSVEIKDAARWGQGVTFFRHIQRMVGQQIFSIGIMDTQVAFKAFKADAVKTLIDRQKQFDFAFDTDWLLTLITQYGKNAVEKVPVVFIDSDKESASKQQELEYPGIKTWEQLLKGITRTVAAQDASLDEQLVKTISELNIEKLQKLVSVLPKQLKDVANKDLGDPKIMSVKEIIQHIRTTT